MKIYKYPLNNKVKQIIKLPIAAKPLTVSIQHDYYMLWAQIDLEADVHDFEILRAVTGDTDIPEDFSYIDTVFEFGFVWHFYYKEL